MPTRACSGPAMPDARRTPVAAALAAWAEDPDIVADPYQLHDGRVWASVYDLLPGALVTPGRTMVAAWGDLTWAAVPTWDEHELDWLWLDPVRRDDLPDVSEHYPDRRGDPVVADLEATIEVARNVIAARRRLAATLMERLGPGVLRTLDEETQEQLARAARQCLPRVEEVDPGS